MRRDEAIALLKQHREELRARFGVRSLALFGSTARDEARPDSDVDLLVEFEGDATFLPYMGLVVYLEEMFGTSVDVATGGELRPRIRPFVQEELIHVA